MQDADPGSRQVPAQRAWIEQGLLIDDDDGRAMQQRGPYLERAGIEGGIGEEGDPVLRLQRRMLLAERERQHGGMRDGHAFRGAGGAGGVDDIGDAAGHDADLRRNGFFSERRELQFQAGNGRDIERKVGKTQQRGGRAIVQQCAQAHFRLRLVQDDIRGAAHQHRQFGHDQQRRARQQQRYRLARLQSDAPKSFGQAGGAAPQFAIAQRERAVDYRRRVGIALDMGVQGFHERGDGGQGDRRGVEAIQHLPALIVRYPGELLYKRIVVRGDGLQQVQELRRIRLDRGVIEQGYWISDDAVQPGLGLLHRQYQVERAHVGRIRQRLQSQARSVLRRAVAEAIQAEQCLEHRRMAQAATALQRFDDALERQLLAILCV